MKTIALTAGELKMLDDALYELKAGNEAQYEFGIDRPANEARIKVVEKLRRKLKKAK